MKSKLNQIEVQVKCCTICSKLINQFNLLERRRKKHDWAAHGVLLHIAVDFIIFCKNSEWIPCQPCTVSTNEILAWAFH